ncbi:MAG: hypothetical protein HZT41_06870 [Dechloromonas sp.]|nr:MAG: hypothetical protein HZT41_06870 [Dechloromonas sp.]
MDAERIRKLIENPSVDRAELERLAKQALSAGERDLALDIQETIDDRFGLEVPDATEDSCAVMASFGTTTKSFPRAVTAYLWLVERFVGRKPSLFTEINEETLFVALGRARTSQGRPFRNYFAKSPNKLFSESPLLAENPNNFAQLCNGWYANKNINNLEKQLILERFGHILRLAEGTDWRFTVTEPSDALQQHLNRLSADDLLAEIEGTLPLGNAGV